MLRYPPQPPRRTLPPEKMKQDAQPLRTGVPYDTLLEQVVQRSEAVEYGDDSDGALEAAAQRADSSVASVLKPRVSIHLSDSKFTVHILHTRRDYGHAHL